MSDLGDLIRNVRFHPVRLREGYDMGEVDYLLDRLQAAVEEGQPLAPILDGVEISQVRVREGYDIEEVDGFLERLRSGGAAAVSTGSTGSTGSTSGRPGFFERLFKRR